MSLCSKEAENVKLLTILDIFDGKIIVCGAKVFTYGMPSFAIVI